MIETVSPGKVGEISSTRPAKKVLFVTRTFDYGGAEKDLIELIRRFREPEAQLTILCLGEDFFSEPIGRDRPVRVVRCKELPKSLWNWARLFRAFRPNVVVFVYGWIWAFPRMAPIGAWLAGIPRLFSIQQLVLSPRGASSSESSAQSKRKPSPREVLERLLHPMVLRISANLFHTTICVSDAMKESLIKDFGFPAKKIRTIHNAVSLSEFVPSKSQGAAMRARLGLCPDEFVLVCTARLSEQKGVDILLQAVARVLRDGVRCKCVIVGDGPLHGQLRKQAQEMGLTHAVIFVGFQHDTRPYLQAGSAFVLTSYAEGLPLSILEAMACGLPSIVTDVGGNTEAVTHQVQGLIVPPGSPDSTAQAIAYLATHPHECANMSKMARERVSKAFDIDNRMAEIRRVILS